MIGAEVVAYWSRWADYHRWRTRVPGVQLAVVDVDGVRLTASHGVANESTGAPLTDAHAFRIASHSKTFTAVATLRLAEQGRLRLDDRVGDLVPDVAGTRLAAVTVRELLSHSGGVIRDSTDGDFWQLFRAFPNHPRLLEIAADPDSAVLERNDQFKYSNIGFGLLGLVIEAVTGQTFAAHVHEAIVAPLGLASVSADLPARVPVADGHSSLLTTRQRQVIDLPGTGALAAATGFVATAADLAAFFRALLPDDHRLLTADAQRQLRHGAWEVKKDELRYGLGVFKYRVGERELFGHSGGFPGHSTQTMVSVDDGIVVCALTNCIDGAASGFVRPFYRLADLARDADHAAAVGNPRWEGRFGSLWEVLDIVRLDGRWFAINPADPDPADSAAMLEPVDDTSLRIVDGPRGGSTGELVRFEFGPDGAVTRVRAESGMSLSPWEIPG